MEEGDEELLKGQKYLCKHEDLCSNPQNTCKKWGVHDSYPGIMGIRGQADLGSSRRQPIVPSSVSHSPCIITPAYELLQKSAQSSSLMGQQYKGFVCSAVKSVYGRMV